MEDRSSNRGDYGGSERSAFRWAGQKTPPDGRQAWADVPVDDGDDMAAHGEKILGHIDQMKTDILRNFEGKRNALKRLTEDKKFLEKQLKELENKNKEIETKHQMRYVHSHADELKKVNQKLQQKNDEYNKLEKQAREVIEMLSKENSELKRKGAEKERDLSLQQKIDEKNKEIQTLHDDRDKLQARLRKMEEDKKNKVLGGKQDITYLSDKNRPAKLAERFLDLYENQWTDALEVLQSRYDFIKDYDKRERKCVSILLDILMDCKQFCDVEAIKQDAELRGAFFRTGKTSVRFPEEMTKQLKEFKKCIAPKSVEYILENYFKQPGTKVDLKYVPEFVQECVTICWLMVQHDPPLDFGPLSEHGDEFNEDLYDGYTSSGTKVDFVVWPPLLLYENGPVIAKGVAQGMKRQFKVLKRPVEPFPEKIVNPRHTRHPKHTSESETYLIHEHQVPSKKDNKSPGFMQDTVASRMRYKQLEDRHKEAREHKPRQYRDYLYYMKKFGLSYAKQALGRTVFNICFEYDNF